MDFRCDETLIGGFQSKQDRNQIDPKYLVDIHTPQVPDLTDDLHAHDGEAVSLRQFADNDGSIVGSEWIYANNKGEWKHRDTRNLSTETTHYGPEGNSIRDPENSPREPR